jgi:hypothetical protein
MDSATIANGIVLAFATSLVTIFILCKTKPSWALRPDNSGAIDMVKVVMYGVTASLLFTVLVTILSLHVDRACAQKKEVEEIESHTTV